jgi:geranylgeranyl diphosphate synthase type I
MDKSKLRRNMPTVHKKYGEPTAIIAGDLLFTKAFESVHNTIHDCSVFKNVEYGLIDCIRVICEGQQMDMEYEQKKNVTEDEYLDMICKKTAVFFQYAAEAGAILGGGTQDQANALNEYGLKMGVGFQIWDDYLDMSSDSSTLGKDIGNDIRNGKKTLIAVHALNNASGNNKKLLQKIFGNQKATNDEIKQVFNLFKKVGSVDYAKQTALRYIDDAKKVISILPETPAKKILFDLADYVISRKK